MLEERQERSKGAVWSSWGWVFWCRTQEGMEVLKRVCCLMHVMFSCFCCKTSSGRAKFHCRSGKGGSDFKYFCCSFSNLREHYVTLLFWIKPLQSSFKQENVVWIWPFGHLGWTAEEKGRWGRKGRAVCQAYRSQLYCSWSFRSSYLVWVVLWKKWVVYQSGKYTEQ